VTGAKKPEERQWLTALLSAGKRSALALTRARILLKADPADGGPAWDDARIAGALDCGLRPSSASASASSSAAWSRRWAASPGTALAGSGGSTAPPRRG
jgi:hypothetical protein